MHSNNAYIVILVIAIVSFLTDLYVYQAVKVLTIDLQPVRLRQILQWAYWLIFFVMTGMVVFGIATLPLTKGFTAFTQTVVNIFITLFVTKLVLIIFLLGEDIYRLCYALFSFMQGVFTGKSSDISYLPDRRKFVSQIALVAAAVPFASFIYGIVKGKYQYTVKRHTLWFEDLPKAFDGFTITQISDIHAGSFNTDDAALIQKGIDLAKRQSSDLFVFTGDMVNMRASEIVPWIDHFNQLKAPFGQYSILGNHDYGLYGFWESEEDQAQDFVRMNKYHADLGYTLMMNEHVILEKEGEKICLLGVENWGVGFGTLGDVDKALAGVDPDMFKILLSHDPTHWEQIIRYHPTKIHLTLSGHTHGMQCGIETPYFRWSPAGFRYEVWAGLGVKNDRHLYVNRGFGFNGFGGRVGIWPEITVLELRKGKAGQ